MQYLNFCYSKTLMQQSLCKLKKSSTLTKIMGLQQKIYQISIERWEINFYLPVNTAFTLFKRVLRVPVVPVFNGFTCDR
jgi:hypothetical protein